MRLTQYCVIWRPVSTTVIHTLYEGTSDGGAALKLEPGTFFGSGKTLKEAKREAHRRLLAREEEIKQLPLRRMMASVA